MQSKSKFKTLNFTLFFLVFSFAFYVPPALAAVINLTAADETTSINDEILVALILDTEGESINVLAGEIIIPDSLRPVKILDGNSLIKFWVEPPRLLANRLIFSGVIPGGYLGANGSLFKFVVRGERAELLGLTIKNLTALLNDGEGTKAEVRIVRLSVPLQPDRTDTLPPEPFTPLISRAPDFFDGRWFAAFAAQDKQSGIDHYEVMENGRWSRAESPYLLTDQSRRSNIYVKAVDRAGNERLAAVIRHRWYQSVWLWIIIILSLCLALFGLRKSRLR